MLTSGRGDITDYSQFQAKVIKHLEEIEGDDTDFYLRIAGDISFIRPKDFGHGIIR